MNSVTPAAVTPCPRPFTPRGWLSSFTFHCSSNPGFDSACTEILSSVRTHDVRCASPSAVSHCVPPRPTWANARLQASVNAAPTMIRRRARIMFLPCTLYITLNPEAIHDAVEDRDVGAAVRDGQSAEVVPRLDRVAARPELLAGLPVEGVQGGAARARDAAHRARAQSATVDGALRRVPGLVGNRLRRILAGRVREDDAVGDDRLVGEIHVARQPRRRELPAARARLQLERGDAAARRPRVLDRRLEILADRTPERREHPLRAVLRLPRA